jgi:Protein of unknown function (DUF4197)
MIKKIGILFLIFQLTACAELQNIAETVLDEDVLTSTDIANGLKEALTIGIGKGSDALSLKDGYFKSQYKILLPEEAIKITEKLKIIPGFSQVEDIILEKINRGAEDAAKKAKPIFVDAIKSMTFEDAMGILMGPNDAATQYLNRSTRTKLYNEFNPVIVTSLNKFNAIEYWADAVNTYNKIPFVEKLNPSLDQYVTEQALSGLFSMVEKEEGKIRTDLSARTSDLLRRVFAKQDN